MIRKLPRPCPKCSKEYGTIQIAYFPNSKRKGSKRSYGNRFLSRWIIRIGHYDSESYKKAKKNYRDSILIDKTALRKKISTSQRKWCSFLSWIPYDLDWTSNMKPNAKFKNYVIKHGWRIYHPF